MVAPEIRRLQVLNDLIAQTLEVLHQRITMGGFGQEAGLSQLNPLYGQLQAQQLNPYQQMAGVQNPFMQNPFIQQQNPFIQQQNPYAQLQMTHLGQQNPFIHSQQLLGQVPGVWGQGLQGQVPFVNPLVQGQIGGVQAGAVPQSQLQMPFLPGVGGGAGQQGLMHSAYAGQQQVPFGVPFQSPWQTGGISQGRYPFFGGGW